MIIEKGIKNAEQVGRASSGFPPSSFLVRYSIFLSAPLCALRVSVVRPHRADSPNALAVALMMASEVMVARAVVSTPLTLCFSMIWAVVSVMEEKNCFSW